MLCGGEYWCRDVYSEFQIVQQDPAPSGGASCHLAQRLTKPRAESNQWPDIGSSQGLSWGHSPSESTGEQTRLQRSSEVSPVGFMIARLTLYPHACSSPFMTLFRSSKSTLICQSWEVRTKDQSVEACQIGRRRQPSPADLCLWCQKMCLCALAGQAHSKLGALRTTAGVASQFPIWQPHSEP